MSKVDQVPPAIMTQAGRLLARRPYFRRELTDRLLGSGHDRAEVEAVVGRLERLGLVDDAGLARDWVSERVRTRPRSREALRRELETRGVEPDAVEQALDSIAPDDLVSARALAVAAVGGMKSLALEVQARRLRSRLLSRGFDADTVDVAVQAVLPPEGWD
jgi:regulatory protein